MLHFAWQFLVSLTRWANPVAAFGLDECAQLSKLVETAAMLDLELSGTVVPTITVGGSERMYATTSLHAVHAHLARDLHWLRGCTVSPFGWSLRSSQAARAEEDAFSPLLFPVRERERGCVSRSKPGNGGGNSDSGCFPVSPSQARWPPNPSHTCTAVPVC